VIAPERVYRSWVEIDAAGLLSNLSAIQHAAGDETEVLAVIKADAYGHGAELCAPVLASAGARWLGVTDAEEGVRIRRALSVAGIAGEDQPDILIMCGSLPEEAAAIAAARLTPVVWAAEHVHALSGLGQVQLHIEIDTGMGRQGAKPGAELGNLLSSLRSRNVTLAGLFTHLCSSEIPGSATTALQKERFETAVAQVRGCGLKPGLLHIANSSAVDHPGDTRSWLNALVQNAGARPMVRTGLGLYGYTLSAEANDQANAGCSVEAPVQRDCRALAARLQPVLTWRARVLSTHTLAPGDTVGYGATFTAAHDMRVALLPVGYADGLRRELSNPTTHSATGSATGTGGWAVVPAPDGNSVRCPIVGRVSMNLTVIDISAAPHLAPGNPVTLLGPGVTAQDHADLAQTIPYEILCALRPLHHMLVNAFY
jgi:alanine racemase